MHNGLTLWEPVY